MKRTRGGRSVGRVRTGFVDGERKQLNAGVTEGGREGEKQGSDEGREENGKCGKNKRGMGRRKGG